MYHLKYYLDSKHKQTVALSGINQKLELQNYIIERDVNELREILQLKSKEQRSIEKDIQVTKFEQKKIKTSLTKSCSALIGFEN